MGSHIEVDLQPGRSYHVYNRGNNGQQVFFREKDYLIFLELVQIYILPIADLYAYCLLRNHFHFALKVKKNRVYKYNIKDAPKEKIEKWACIERPDNYKERGLKTPDPSKHLSHMFNSYAKYLNNKYDRHGSIFEKPFRRRIVHGINDLKNVIVYVNNNAVHHRIANSIIEYPWSGYWEVVNAGRLRGAVFSANAARSCDAGRLGLGAARFDGDATRLNSLIAVSDVLDLFGGIDGFKELHLQGNHGLMETEDMEG